MLLVRYFPRLIQIDCWNLGINEFSDVWSTNSVRDIAESKRKCRFPDEGDMLYYRNYTRNNCMLECVHRFILEACGCQPYFHPSETCMSIIS